MFGFYKSFEFLRGTKGFSCDSPCKCLGYILQTDVGLFKILSSRGFIFFHTLNLPYAEVWFTLFFFIIFHLPFGFIFFLLLLSKRGFLVTLHKEARFIYSKHITLSATKKVVPFSALISVVENHGYYEI